MNQSVYKISGLERRQLKKELGSLKSFVRYYSFCEQIDSDMRVILKLEPIKDDLTGYSRALKQIENLELRLKELL